MFTETTWRDAADMVRAGRERGMTMLIRVQAEPWAVQRNGQIIVDAGRALSIGAEGVVFSVSDRWEVEGVLKVAGEWHRNLSAIPFTRETFDAHVKSLEESTLMVPLIESPASFDNMEEIVSTPGLKVVMIGTTDTAVSLGHGVNSDHPEVWDMVDKLRKLCDRYGVAMWANTAMGFSTLPLMTDRAEKLREHGVDIILYQTPELLLQMAGKHVVDALAKVSE
ncbi:MAG: aldolase/citrate lyase family protein [Actinophytocola sp.]